jgi:hypothetical protein
MPGGPPPHPVHRSSDGEGLTEGPGTHVRPRAAGDVRGMPDEVPDEPRHLPLNADRVLGGEAGPESAVPEKPHVMPCDHGWTGQTPFCDHSGTGAVHHRRGTEPADRPPRGAPDG